MTVSIRSSWHPTGWTYLALVTALSGAVTLPFLEYAFPNHERNLITTYFNPALGVVRHPFDLVYKGLLFVVLLYLLAAPRYVRRRVQAAMTDIPLVANEPEREVQKAFRWANSRLPPMVAAAGCATAYVFLFFARGGRVEMPFIPVFGLDALIVAVRLFITFTFIWVYLASLFGLQRLAMQPWRFRPYHEDRLLGMRPFGSLWVSIAVACFLGGALGFLWINLATTDPILPGLAAIVVVGGVALLFLPVLVVHAKMVGEKQRVRDRVDKQFITLFADITPDREQDLAGMIRAIRDMTAYGEVERRVGSIRTWPFDTPTLTRLFSSLAVPLLLTLIGGLMLQFLRLSLFH